MTAVAATTPTDSDRFESTPGRSGLDWCVASFLVLATIFGVVFTIITPSFWGNDEGEHFKRSWVITEGQILPRLIPSSRGSDFGGEIPATVDTLIAYAYEERSDLPDPPQRQVVDPAEFDRLERAPLRAPPVTVSFANTSTYSPLAYAGPVAAVAIMKDLDVSVGATLTWMRLSNLALALAISALALRVLRESPFRWVALVVALLPTTVFQNAMITTDAVTNAVALLFAALFIKAAFLDRSLGKGGTTLLLVAGVLLPVIKASAVVLPLLLLFLPRRSLALGRYQLAVVGAAVVTALVGFATWSALTAQTGPAQSFMRPEAEWGTVAPDRQAELVLSNPIGFVQLLWRTFVYRDDLYFQQFFGDLGFSFVSVPAAAVVCSITAFVVSFGLSERVTVPALRSGGVLLVLVAGVLSVFGALLLGFTPVGYYFIDGVQGRYFVPFAVVFAAVMAAIVPLRWSASTAQCVRARQMTVGLLGCALLLSAAKYAYVLWH